MSIAERETLAPFPGGSAGNNALRIRLGQKEGTARRDEKEGRLAQDNAAAAQGSDEFVFSRAQDIVPPSVVRHRAFVLFLALLDFLVATLLLTYFGVIPPSFYTIGPPVMLGAVTITDPISYVMLLLVYMTHQFIFTWSVEIVDSWVTHQIHDVSKGPPSVLSPVFVNAVVALFRFYRLFNLFIVFNAVTTQIVFFVGILFSTVLPVYVVTYSHQTVQHGAGRHFQRSRARSDGLLRLKDGTTFSTPLDVEDALYFRWLDVFQFLMPSNDEL